jgi:predicted nucleotidyltransferase
MNLKNIVLSILEENKLNTFPIRSSAERVSEILDKNGIPSMLVGGFAVHMFGYSRFTSDADFVVTQKNRAIDVLVANGFKRVRGTTMSVTDETNGIQIDFLETGAKDSPSAIPYPEIEHVNKSGKINVVSLETLIVMKLSAFISSGIHRLQDKVDVAKLIDKNKLPVDYMKKSKHVEIKKEYVKIWKELSKNSL